MQTPVQSSQQILTELERNNLFLFPLGSERVWYRYHHLFAEVLRDRLMASHSLDQVAILHRRAGAWYAAHGMLTQAVNHALQAQAFDDVVAMLEPIGLAVISQVGEVTLRRWLPSLPVEAFERHPRLALLHEPGWRRLIIRLMRLPIGLRWPNVPWPASPVEQQHPSDQLRICAVN
ncbi:hypothetical protein [Chloroflexus sp.]|uniref:hypothetical protein n=1 Tax=Chloroflexus sp. TaxID=1904827 RepID=UPI004049859C